MTTHRLSTARARLVATLAEEILQRDDPTPFVIESEHQLCRRFQISRVTVRLALGDLENRGLIYRKHGKGTFAHGRAQHVHRDIGFLVKGGHLREFRPVMEMIRGAQAYMAPLRASVVLLSQEPETWRPDLAGHLGGVIVVPEGVAEHDLQVLRERKIPFLLALPTLLPGPKVNFGFEESARTVTERLLQLGHRRFALLSGGHAALEASLRAGFRDALESARIDPVHVTELHASPDHEGIAAAMARFFQLQPRPTALLALDDHLALMAASHLRREGVRIPQEVSLAGFHESALSRQLEPGLSAVAFDFCEAGRRAAENLHHAGLTGVPVTDLFVELAPHEGQTVAPPPDELTSGANAAA